MFRAQAEVSSSPESGDNAYVFVLVTSQPSCVLFTFHCSVLNKIHKEGSYFNLSEICIHYAREYRAENGQKKKTITLMNFFKNTITSRNSIHFLNGAVRR